MTRAGQQGNEKNELVKPFQSRRFIYLIEIKCIIYCVINSRWAEIRTECTWQQRNLVHRVGLNWLVKFSSPSPSFPCRPSPKVYKRPLSETSTNTNRIICILEERNRGIDITTKKRMLSGFCFTSNQRCMVLSTLHAFNSAPLEMLNHSG